MKRAAAGRPRAVRRSKAFLVRAGFSACPGTPPRFRERAGPPARAASAAGPGIVFRWSARAPDRPPGRRAGRPGSDSFRPAGADRLDDLPGGPLRVHRQQRQAGAEREPGELLPGLPGETGQAGTGAHKPGYDGGNRHRAAAEFGAQPFGESDGSELGGALGQQVRDAELTADRRDRDDPAGSRMAVQGVV